MVGIAPVADALGRVNKLEVVPMEELGRPRIDVVVNCSGVFRDLFVNQMNLLDRAIKLAAEQDEPDELNFVRKHAKQQVGPGGLLGVGVPALHGLGRSFLFCTEQEAPDETLCEVETWSVTCACSLHALAFVLGRAEQQQHPM